MHLQPIIFAFGLTLFAGLSTGVGSTIALFAKRTNTRFLSAALGFSAGVMIYVSLIEIFGEAREILSTALGNSRGYLITTISFFAGIAVIALIDTMVPSLANPHEIKQPERMKSHKKNFKKGALLRVGVLSALAITIHNFPEGLATFAGALKEPVLGISIAVAVAIHNIPEGIAVSVPLYYATGNRKKAFFYSFLTGLAEPIGAVVGYVILYRFLNDVVFGILFASIAGIMVFISLDGLLPTAEEYGDHHVAIYGLVSGMAVMALSLLLFAQNGV